MVGMEVERLIDAAFAYDFADRSVTGKQVEALLERRVNRVELAFVEVTSEVASNAVILVAAHQTLFVSGILKLRYVSGRKLTTNTNCLLKIEWRVRDAFTTERNVGPLPNLDIAIRIIRIKIPIDALDLMRPVIAVNTEVRTTKLDITDVIIGIRRAHRDAVRGRYGIVHQTIDRVIAVRVRNTARVDAIVYQTVVVVRVGERPDGRRSNCCLDVLKPATRCMVAINSAGAVSEGFTIQEMPVSNVVDLPQELLGSAANFLHAGKCTGVGIVPILSDDRCPVVECRIVDPGSPT